MPMKRVVEAVGNNIALRRWVGGRKRQQTWKFDQVSKTIKSQYRTNYSIDIAGNGSSTNLRVTTTNSRWW
jgi:hypothetical protein